MNIHVHAHALNVHVSYQELIWQAILVVPKISLTSEETVKHKAKSKWKCKRLLFFWFWCRRWDQGTVDVDNSRRKTPFCWHNCLRYPILWNWDNLSGTSYGRPERTPNPLEFRHNSMNQTLVYTSVCQTGSTSCWRDSCCAIWLAASKKRPHHIPQPRGSLFVLSIEGQRCLEKP